MSTILQGLTDQPKQNWPVPLPDGTTATMTLAYRPQQFAWFYDLSWDGLTPPLQVLGNRLVASPNILRQFRELLPFGITVSTTDGLDPTTQEDFVDGTCTLLSLDAGDVAAIEATYFPGN